MYYLFPQALEFLKLNYKDLGFRKVMSIPVSGPFHTKHMRPAANAIKEVISQIQVRPKGRYPVFRNCDSKPFTRATASNIMHMLEAGLTGTIMWEQTMRYMYLRPQDIPMPSTYEVGPARQLGTILRTCNRRGYEEYGHVDC